VSLRTSNMFTRAKGRQRFKVMEINRLKQKVKRDAEILARPQENYERQLTMLVTVSQDFQIQSLLNFVLVLGHRICNGKDTNGQQRSLGWYVCLHPVSPLHSFKCGEKVSVWVCCFAHLLSSPDRQNHCDSLSATIPPSPK
jgi:hypothetical protein